MQNTVRIICQNKKCCKSFFVWKSIIKRKIPRFCCRDCQKVFTRSEDYIVERFWKQVIVCEHGVYCDRCCWIFSGFCNVDGYGYFYYPGEKSYTNYVRAHVF